MNHNTLTPTKTPPSLIETERLRLRAPRIEDAFALRDLAASDPAFAYATVGEAPSTLEDACTAIARMLRDRHEQIGAWWIVEEKATGRAIGLTGYSSRIAAGPIHALATDVLGRGYARETIAALIASVAPQVPAHPQTDDEPDSSDHRHEPATRWYWHNKAARPPRRGLRCA